SISRSVLAFTSSICCPMASAPACRARVRRSALIRVGLTSTDITVAFGGLRPLRCPVSSEIHRRAHKISLAELDPAMAQDVIRRCAVKIEVRQDEILQQPLPREFALIGAELDGDVLVLGAVDLRRLEGFAVVDRLGEARLEFGKAWFRVGHVRHLGSGKGATTPGGGSR